MCPGDAASDGKTVLRWRRVPGSEQLITREWAILAGENDYTTGTFQQITGPRPQLPSSFMTTARNSPDARASSSPGPARRLPRQHQPRLAPFRNPQN